MAYFYKTILRRENHVFDLCQNKSNSKYTSILYAPKGKEWDFKIMGQVDNKTLEVKITDLANFKESTIAELKKRIF